MVEVAKPGKTMAVGLVLSLSSQLVLLILGLLLGVHSAVRYLPWIMYGLFLPGMIVGTIGMIFAVRQMNGRRPLADLPLTVVQVPAAISLRREVAFGVTPGLVSFVDGWLVFSGRALHFSVRREDVMLGIDDGKCQFQFEGPDGVYVATFRRAKFQNEWTEWVRSTASVEGLPVYPAVMPAPSWKPNSVGRWYGLFLMVSGLAMFKFAPPVRVCWFVAGGVMFISNRIEQAAINRLRAGLPMRTTGILAAVRRFKQGYSFGESARLLVAREGPATSRLNRPT